MTRKGEEPELIYKEESYAIVGACMAAYKDKGCGFLEPVYQECLAIEFAFRGIPFLSKPPQTLQYRGRTLVQTFSPDFLCYEKIILEIKAVSSLVDEHRAQILNYLSATNCKLGLLVNFETRIRAASSEAPPTCRSSALKILASFRIFRGQKNL
jgi:GxxExxY protein